jgi:hypothetical protein
VQWNLRGHFSARTGINQMERKLEPSR